MSNSNSNVISKILSGSEGLPIVNSDKLGLVSSSSSSSSSIGSSFGSSNGFVNSVKSISALTWFLIILLLAFLGFNIFVYLEKGTESVVSVFKPLFDYFLGTTANVTGQVVDVSAEGAKYVTNTAAGAVNTSLSAVQDATPQGTTGNSSLKTTQVTKQQPDQLANSTLNRALNGSGAQTTDYQANEASSSLPGKAGWCYVGEDRGHRSCAEVSASDTCMSGDIFPSHELCINPNLRA